MKGVKHVMRTAPGVIIGKPLLVQFTAQQPVIVFDLIRAVVKEPGEVFLDTVIEAFEENFRKISAPRIVFFRHLPGGRRIESAVVSIGKKSGDTVAEIRCETAVVLFVNKLEW